MALRPLALSCSRPRLTQLRMAVNSASSPYLAYITGAFHQAHVGPVLTFYFNTCGGQERASHLLKLELKVVVTCHMVLGTKLGSLEEHPVPSAAGSSLQPPCF